jgi:predicted metalloprotease with PDZ domain
MMRDMPKGEPQDGDEGLDNTHTWARTYWGGAMYCLRADLMIRQRTNNRKGLQDALRAIVAGGGNLTKEDWSLDRALKIGDRATGTKVLEQLYAEMKNKPVQVDLPAIWRELGISVDTGKVKFNDHGKLVSARIAITQPPHSERPLIALGATSEEHRTNPVPLNVSQLP